jgi:hypothetical protein
MSRHSFILPLTTCAYWAHPNGTEEGAAPGEDPRFAADSVIEFSEALHKEGPVISEAQVLLGVALKGTFSFVVSPRGTVVDVLPLSCNNEEFAAACIQAIHAWKFKPMRLNGEPVYCRLQVPIAWNS